MVSMETIFGKRYMCPPFSKANTRVRPYNSALFYCDSV